MQPFLQQAGVGIQYRVNGDLKQVLKPTSEEIMWILMYADDIALMSTFVWTLGLCSQVLHVGSYWFPRPASTCARLMSLCQISQTTVAMWS